MEDGGRGGGVAVVGHVGCMAVMEEKGFVWGGGAEELDGKEEEGASSRGSFGGVTSEPRRR